MDCVGVKARHRAIIPAPVPSLCTADSSRPRLLLRFCLPPLKLILLHCWTFLNFDFMLLMLFWGWGRGVFELHHGLLSFWMAVTGSSSTLPLLWRDGLYQRGESPSRVAATDVFKSAVNEWTVVGLKRPQFWGGGVSSSRLMPLNNTNECFKDKNTSYLYIFIS